MITKELVRKISPTVQAELFRIGVILYKSHGTTIDVAKVYSAVLLKEALRLMCFTYDLEEPTENELLELKNAISIKLVELKKERIQNN